MLLNEFSSRVLSLSAYPYAVFAIVIWLPFTSNLHVILHVYTCQQTTGCSRSVFKTMTSFVLSIHKQALHVARANDGCIMCRHLLNSLFISHFKHPHVSYLFPITFLSPHSNTFLFFYCTFKVPQCLTYHSNQHSPPSCGLLVFNYDFSSWSLLYSLSRRNSLFPVHR